MAQAALFDRVRLPAAKRFFAILAKDPDQDAAARATCEALLPARISVLIVLEHR